MDHLKYGNVYTKNRFFTKIGRHAKSAGFKVIYSGLLLYYALENPRTPRKAKALIYGALGYLILPIDLIVDIAPLVGFTDDLGVLAFAVAQVAVNIDDSVIKKAQDKLKDFFAEKVSVNGSILDIDKEINKQD